MGLIDRIWRLIRSNINSMAQAEDPEKVLCQLVMDMQEDLIHLRQAVAQAIACQKRAERKCLQVETTADQWRARAQLALVQGDEMLARQALVRRQPYSETARALREQIAQQRSLVGKLRQDLQALEQKIAEVKAKKDWYIARARAAKASVQINSIMGQLNRTPSMSPWERMEEQVHQSAPASVVPAIARAELTKDIGGGEDKDERSTSMSAGSDVDRELALLKAQM